MKKIIVLGMSVALIGLMCQISAAVPKDKVGGRIAGNKKQLKPFALAPRLTIPSEETVKKVGGIQYGRHIDVKLKDGTTVRCFPEATSDPSKTSKTYYYLPANPRIARDPDGTPKFSMVRFVTNKAKEAGGAEGAIIHFLVEYGLTKKQHQEVKKLLLKQVKGARLKGAVPLEVGAEGNSFHVVSATLTDKGFTSTLVTSVMSSL